MDRKTYRWWQKGPRVNGSLPRVELVGLGRFGWVGLVGWSGWVGLGWLVTGFVGLVSLVGWLVNVLVL